MSSGIFELIRFFVQSPVQSKPHHWDALNVGSKPLKERTSKAERRAKQEAERAAKQAGKEVGKPILQPPG